MKTIRSSYTGNLWLYVKYVTLTVFRNADTVTIRLLLATASIGYAACLILDPHTFQRHGYEVIRRFGNEYCWAAAFFLHYVGVVWRTYDPVERIRWALLINGFGFAIWAVMTASLNLAFGQITPGTALEWTLVGASGWALFRTGLSGESVSA